MRCARQGSEERGGMQTGFFHRAEGWQRRTMVFKTTIFLMGATLICQQHSTQRARLGAGKRQGRRLGFEQPLQSQRLPVVSETRQRFDHRPAFVEIGGQQKRGHRGSRRLSAQSCYLVCVRCGTAQSRMLCDLHGPVVSASSANGMAQCGGAEEPAYFPQAACWHGGATWGNQNGG